MVFSNQVCRAAVKGAFFTFSVSEELTGVFYFRYFSFEASLEYAFSMDMF